MVSKVSKLATSTSQQRTITCSKSGIEFESCLLNVIWLLTIEHGRSCDIISFTKLMSVLENECQIRKGLRESGFEPLPTQNVNHKNLISSKKVKQWDLNLRC